MEVSGKILKFQCLCKTKLSCRALHYLECLLYKITLLSPLTHILGKSRKMLVYYHLHKGRMRLPQSLIALHGYPNLTYRLLLSGLLPILQISPEMLVFKRQGVLRNRSCPVSDTIFVGRGRGGEGGVNPAKITVHVETFLLEC